MTVVGRLSYSLVLVVLTYVAVASPLGTNRGLLPKNYAFCRALELTEAECRSSSSETNSEWSSSCFNDVSIMGEHNVVTSCAEMCTADELKSFTVRMKCSDYCGDYIKNDCQTVNVRSETVDGRLSQLESDIRYLVIQQHRIYRLLKQTPQQETDESQ